jgi:uncharacterized RDD family membrane protein YckC
MNEVYYILVDGEQTGPYTFDELIDQEPEIHTRIMAPSADTWQDACDLPELFEFFRERGTYFPTEDNLASYWWRLLATLIDLLLLSFLMSFILPVLNQRGLLHIKLDSFDPYKTSQHDVFVIQIIFNSIIILYNSICEASSLKGSLGKKVCGLVVVDADGQGLKYGVALFRSFGKVVSIFFWGVGTFSIFWTEHKQALHDFLAKTYVVRKNV